VFLISIATKTFKWEFCATLWQQRCVNNTGPAAPLFIHKKTAQGIEPVPLMSKY
jgi:hypothetical protein